MQCLFLPFTCERILYLVGRVNPRVRDISSTLLLGRVIPAFSFSLYVTLSTSTTFSFSLYVTLSTSTTFSFSLYVTLSTSTTFSFSLYVTLSTSTTFSFSLYVTVSASTTFPFSLYVVHISSTLFLYFLYVKQRCILLYATLYLSTLTLLCSLTTLSCRRCGETMHRQLISVVNVTFGPYFRR